MKEGKLISSADNSLVKQLRSMQEVGVRSAKVRLETGLALIEGVHLAQSWLGSEDLCELFTTQEGLNQAEVAAVIETQLALVPTTNLYILEETLWKKVTDLGSSAPIIACIKIPQSNFPSNFFDDIVILDAIQDAGNVGSILRTAAGAGIKYVACMKGTAQIWSPKVLRAAMGAHRHLKLFEFWSLNTLRDKVKQPLLATSSYAQESLYDIPHELQKACAWVFGNEGKGVSPEIMGMARGLNIPQESCIESLNVAASAAICLFEMVRSRRC